MNNNTAGVKYNVDHCEAASEASFHLFHLFLYYYFLLLYCV